jgi:hypothetical protein
MKMMEKMNNRKSGRTQKLVAVCAIGLVIGAVASCSGETQAPAHDGKVTKSAATPGTSTAAVGAKADLSGFTCKADDRGSWTASGTLTNSLDKVQSYELLVTVSKAKTGTVVGSVSKSYRVKSKDEVKVTLPDFVKGQKAKGLTCTSHVVRSSPE